MIERRITSKDTFDLEFDNLIQKRSNLRHKKFLKKQFNVSPIFSSSQVSRKRNITKVKDSLGTNNSYIGPETGRPGTKERNRHIYLWELKKRMGFQIQH